MNKRRNGVTARQRLFLAFWISAWVGCAAHESVVSPDPPDVELSLADRAELDAIIARQRGQVVLVDFWALWCEPCVANFPHVVELANRLGERGLSVVTVSMDATSAATQTLEFLQSRGAGRATNLLSRLGGGSQAMAAFEIPGGAVPCYRLYDRNGKLRHTFAVDPRAERQFTLQDLDAAVERLLAE